MKRKLSGLVVLLCFFSYSRLSAQSDTTSICNGFKFEASYIGDVVNNLSGGIKTGTRYLGMANIRAGFDTEKAGLWKGTFVYVNAANTHGAMPSAELLGDMQVASNIEAGNHTYIQELWIKQAFKNLELTAGLQDLNVEFAASEYGAMFLNSSFGILPIVSGNIPAPIFPLTSLGLTAKWNILKNTTLLAAVYDGSPSDFDYNPYNLNWRFNNGDGMLAIAELQQQVEINKLPGVYKLGAYTHNHFIGRLFDQNFPDSLNHTTLGLYAYGDQELWQSGNKNLGMFFQLGYSPSKQSANHHYVGLGMNLTGLFGKTNSNILGLAVAHSGFEAGMGSETTIEMSYQANITPNVFIQPDIQYIIDPSGGYSDLDNCFVATLRVGLSF